MAICDSIVSPALLGQTVCVTTQAAGFTFEHIGQVVGVLVALPGTRATASLLIDEGSDRIDFFDSTDIHTLHVL